ncbi:hypothetical protein Bca52824_010172 [Brassica carinata]|uniref:Uncharacterized protein n=1 Tax=Brassica carinata TaxID=52824 RepID=A0A8X8B7G6_BRACI|nr:hypothetical protein Bca52824_010172 [Brassica carinata]
MVYQPQPPPSSDPSPPPSDRFLGITSPETPSNNQNLETERVASNPFKLGSQRWRKCGKGVNVQTGEEVSVKLGHD